LFTIDCFYLQPSSTSYIRYQRHVSFYETRPMEICETDRLSTSIFSVLCSYLSQRVFGVIRAALVFRSLHMCAIRISTCTHENVT